MERKDTLVFPFKQATALLRKIATTNSYDAHERIKQNSNK